MHYYASCYLGRTRYATSCNAQKRQEAFTSYKDYIGMDITSLVTLPVWIMEPFTILQRLAEIMEYTDQLDRAAGTEDQYERWASCDVICAGQTCRLPH